ncbi:HD domain protein [Geobacter sp. OR-1]|uniref:HD domain-containing protein n=1 Tax=Geobacter sp. OR-1 TaxID=1266765 RepID=UPI000543FC10|nr:HD domain-containing protein [Geobacter sp. OR-1]GAM08152.1 HD domain protein [Geobacter sp. OR-1]
MHEEKLRELENWLKDYWRSFAGDDAEAGRNYALKELHTTKVRDNIRLLAESTGLSGDRLALAEIIGLLHDVGRFEQYRRHRTFYDSKSENHAALGVRVIRESRLLEGLTNEEADIILQAVGLHNVFRIPASVSGTHRLYLNLIRDADKLDIWRVFVDQSLLPDTEQASAANLDFPDLPECSAGVLECIGRREMVNLSLLRTVNDFRLLQLSWVFDLHFPVSFKLARERGDLARLGAMLPFSPEVERSLRTVWEFLGSRCS